ncbi:hypothetical protein BI023_gp54 [Mycobacterium phage Sneeze]|uniref:Uncharacterized protein n=1 Tax=Mycobacterium phage Rabbs TaxID=2530143 RepID=A0A481VSG5_9CAUD|nr:hypothetical protein BI023_gp54 [Mycobacterium phage Sneeze]YP_010051400.1 hypothetical protein KDW71_gp55 [Mycobacterium phage Rabbs]ANU79760.1 hypothetical protein SEA_SNEEZE_54 [Mycobacterium phage Sneeze]QBI96806.1 hypothetical protein SEA_RABBS_55 [Mycobacterium phage Rabbs]
MTRRMTPDEHFDEIEELGRKIWESLPDEQRRRHRIDRSRLTQGAQCVCTCGEVAVYWVAHLQDVRDHAELWERLNATASNPQRILLGLGQIPPDELGACCGHEYRRHLVGLDGCAACEHIEPVHARCTSWRRQLEGVDA